MLQLLQLFILLSPPAVCLVWLVESGRLRRGYRETPLLAEPESDGWPWSMPLWPFDMIVSNAVAGMTATHVPPIPDAMLDSGLALYRAATNVTLDVRASNAVPAYAWECHAADNRGIEFALPFDFPLGTNRYGRAGILSNGRLSFGYHTYHRRTPDGLPFATPYPVATLAPLWGPYGLLLSADSGVWMQGCSNRFTVCWHDMLLLGDTNHPATAQCDVAPDGAVRFRYGAIPVGAVTNSTVGVQNLGPGWSFTEGSVAPVFAGLQLSLRPVAAAGWADADPDVDGLTNFEEFMIGTDERLADSDGDGPSDAWEPAHGFDPLTPQISVPDPDTDDDGVPDRWAGWMGDITNAYSAASLCTDTDGDGFTDWYELFALGSNPLLAASPGAAPKGFVDVVAVVTSSLPCVLRLTGGAGLVELPWIPGLSPGRLRLRLEVGKVYQTELSRVPLGTSFPANGFWWAAVACESPDLPTSQPAVADGTVTYDAGTVRITSVDRGRDWWAVPGAATIPALRLEVRLIVIDGPQTFCQSSTRAEITLATHSLYTGNVIWFSAPEEIAGEGDTLVINPSNVTPGFYTVYAVSEENPLVWGITHVAISHLSLIETEIYVDYANTNLVAIGLSGSTYPNTGVSVTSNPSGISDLFFRPSDLEPGTYTVTVNNGSCETREVEVIVVSLESVEAYCGKFGSTGSFGVNPEVFPGGADDFGEPDLQPPYWWLPGTYANPASRVHKIFYKYIKDANGEPGAFDIELTANVPPTGIPDSQLDITWHFWGGPSDSGAYVERSGREVRFRNPTKGGLYRFHVNVGALPYGTQVGNAWVLLPKAGGEIANWMVAEVPALIARADDWEVAVRAVAAARGLDGDDFLETAWKAIVTCDFDYQGIVGSPTKRYSFTDADRPHDHVAITNIPGMRGDKGNGDWDEPSYATLRSVVVSRAKINNAMYAVWGRRIGFTEEKLKVGAIYNAIRRNFWDDSTSQNAIGLGCDLYLAYVNDDSLSAVLTEEEALSIQSPDTPSGLNDVNLWPDPTPVASGFWLSEMPTDYDSLKAGENAAPRGRLF